ncbi:zinc finger protein 431-like [Vanessa tameamea]|uniref:Zinc finger protein 431-like n=1 Tax=Vanessa tameamea TaxID=334116 RepID=A0A8B8I755_VANTA
MENGKVDKNQYCLGCLGRNDEFNLRSYKFRNEFFKSLFQVECVLLCYICKCLFQKSEQFIQNVQSNQIFMSNVNVADSTIQMARIEFTPSIALSTVEIDSIELTGNKEEIVEPVFVTYSRCKSKDIKIKLELKEEEEDHLEGVFIDDNESYLKGEDDFPLKTLIKAESADLLDDISLKQLRKTLKKSRVKKRNEKSEEELENIDNVINVIHITREQCLRERSQMIKDPKYMNSVYKCEHCIKGFTFKDSYEKHLEKHDKSIGEYECDICKQRMGTMDKLLSHQRYHRVRYKCSECDLTRISRLTIKDHYTAFHLQDTFQYRCSHCNKLFKRQVSLRKHVAYAHVRQKRAKCKYCQKTYANKEVLKSHMIGKHSTEVTSGEVSLKKHVCQDCGAAFKAPSQLKNHMIKHSLSRNYHCVECDRSFKSYNALKQHLKVAAPHVNYMELPFVCDHCDKRFGVRRDLERHMNRVHLNIKPYQCDKCNKAYVNGWSLTEHKRFTHEGHKRPLKFPCPLCDKVFDRNATRKAHIRTHTGERPYSCSKCPAKFSQASVLGTHVKLVHLKLTRDGRPKAPLAVK